ncbi:MAG: hypothetical protein H6677_04255 [Candidatus Obscuribacterales bacterium]|nr:hypothetical protein [Candidatus Obscuribacterales bacterium]
MNEIARDFEQPLIGDEWTLLVGPAIDVLMGRPIEKNELTCPHYPASIKALG